jgi:hypothetical protein
MALLWLDGFEGYGETIDANPAPSGVLQGKYCPASSTNTMLIRAGRHGGFAIYYGSSTNELRTPHLTTHDTMIVGCGFYRSTLDACAIMSFIDTGTLGMWLRVKQETGELELLRGGATLIATTSGLNIGLSNWHWIEMKIKCHSSAGEYEVRVGGETVLSATGVNTKEGSNDYHDTFGFRPVPSEAPMYDDLYVCDGSGSINNDFLGDCKIVRIDPDGDDTTNWGTSTPSANHYENISEVEGDEDTSYIEETASSTLDLFDYEAVAGLGTIYGVQICTQCRESDAASHSLITPIESGGNQYDDSAQVVGTPDYITAVRVAGTDPDTSSLWTMSGLNAAKFGVKVG